MSDPRPDASLDPAATVSILTTEHFTLQTARGATISEANGRASTFLSSVSGVLLALSLLASSTKVGVAFAVAALILGLMLLLLGLTTFQRLLESGIEDVRYGQGINRIRHYYLEHAPGLRPYLIQTDHDDLPSVMSNMGVEAGRGQTFVTGASGVMVVVAALAGGLVGGVSALARLPLWLVFALALLALGLSLWALASYQNRFWARFFQWSTPAFPAPNSER